MLCYLVVVCKFVMCSFIQNPGYGFLYGAEILYVNEVKNDAKIEMRLFLFEL